MTAPLLLMTPGPTRVPERVLLAGARPMLHHRTAEFSAELAAVLELLAPFFGTRELPLPIHATGRGAMEATLCNLLSPGEAIGACCNGRFGELWVKLAASHGLAVHRIATDWNQDVDPADVEQLLVEHPETRAIAMAYGDTSTGVANDVRGVARVTRSRNVLLFVDGVSSIGGMPFAFDEWGVDAAITASQKCLMSSPGLSFVVTSERARAAAARATLPRAYWDFDVIRREASKARPEPAGTPPVHCMLQVAEALRMLHEEGVEAVFRRHAAMGEMTRQGIAALGLQPQCPGLKHRSNTVTPVALPTDIPPARVRDGLKSRGILVAGGLEQFQPSAFRIGHMGDIRPVDVQRTLDALREVLG
ncbi:MAG TPA: alanine--glyoxylate aminotransferase family protein [Vicinamibacterales bacterium]|nr:alanine--glyoxylate aminotransferase family protein [Vicinamibacterales bacterium]